MRHVSYAAACVWMSVGGATAQPAGNCDGWSPIGDPFARPRFHAAYDTNAGRLMMFGGHSQIGSMTTSESYYFDDAWFYGADGWQFIPQRGPGRDAVQYGSGNSLAFDPTRNMFVFVGGWSFDGTVGTWEFDGVQWTRVANANASPVDPALVYDPIAEEVVAVTGTVAQRWNGSAWRVDAAWGSQTLPLLRQVAWHVEAGGIVVAGVGANEPTLLFANGVWQTLSQSSPQFNGSIVYDRASGRLVQFPEFREDGVDRTLYELKDGEWRSIAGTGLPQLQQRWIYFDERLGCIVALGSPARSGTARPPMMYRLTQTGWQAIAPTMAPTERYHHMMAFDSHRHVSVLVSGTVLNGTIAERENLRTTWELRGERWRERTDLLTTMPTNTPDSNEATADYDPVRRRIVAVRNNGQNFEFDGTGWIQTSTNDPYLPRWDPVRQRMIGYNRNQSQMHLGFAEYNPTGTRRWTPITITGAGTAIGIRPQFAIDPVTDRYVVKGESGAAAAVARTMNAPVPRAPSRAQYPGPIVYDPIRAGMVQFSGFRSTISGENPISYPVSTGVLAPGATTWQALPFRGPAGRKYFEAVWDAAAERIVIFGGFQNTELDDTWKLAQGPARVGVPPVATSAQAGETAELFTIAKGGGAISYTWRKDGQVVPNSARVEGATRDTLLINDVSAADAGMYTVTVTNPCGTETSQPVLLTVLGDEPACDSIDFNRNAVFPEDQDVIEFFAVLAGADCPYVLQPGEVCDIDFNNNAVFPEDQDVMDFFAVLAGGEC